MVKRNKRRINNLVFKYSKTIIQFMIIISIVVLVHSINYVENFSLNIMLQIITLLMILLIISGLQFIRELKDA